MRLFGQAIIGLAVLAASALGASGDAYAKARHPKGNSDGSGIFMAPAPETKPLFIMVQQVQVKPAAPVPEERLKLPSLPGPTGTAMGKENAPIDGDRTYYQVRTVDSLKIPLLFR